MALRAPDCRRFRCHQETLQDGKQFLCLVFLLCRVDHLVDTSLALLEIPVPLREDELERHILLLRAAVICPLCLFLHQEPRACSLVFITVTQQTACGRLPPLLHKPPQEGPSQGAATSTGASPPARPKQPWAPPPPGGGWKVRVRTCSARRTCSMLAGPGNLASHGTRRIRAAQPCCTAWRKVPG